MFFFFNDLFIALKLSSFPQGSGLELESSQRIMKTPRAEAVLQGRACEPPSWALRSKFKPCQGHCNHRGRCLGDEMNHVGPPASGSAVSVNEVSTHGHTHF